ncbi:TPA: hypothetical protein RQK93_000690 [Vibrio vulnificus]|nr:hypothetical protein [Vibrio vulnificus]EJP4175458.1 hypothetical protein [Vibrio vulnificus]ELX4197050.1 hypothetical protein [Vibrio vulnificus]HDY8068497.1 hypothetical protein [Vibrio vulnificus]
MEINKILDSVSLSLKELNLQNSVNNYNMLASRTNNQQFEVSRIDGDEIKIEKAKEKIAIDELIMNAVDISSRHQKIISLLNSRIELERLVYKGMK